MIDLDPTSPTLTFQLTARKPRLPEHNDIPEFPTTVDRRELMAAPDMAALNSLFLFPEIVQTLPKEIEEHSQLKTLCLVERIGQVTQHTKAV